MFLNWVEQENINNVKWDITFTRIIYPNFSCVENFQIWQIVHG